MIIAKSQGRWIPRAISFAHLVLLIWSLAVLNARADPSPAGAISVPSSVRRPPAGFEFIDTSFENASPLWYDFQEDGTINIHLLYDNERDSVNRAAGHFHFLVVGRPGAHLALEFKNLENIWNGRPGSVAKELKTAVVSEDGKNWRPVPLETIATNRVRLKVVMPRDKLYLARLEPYRLSDLKLLLASIRTNALAHFESIGETVEGRRLEIVRIGETDAPHRVFLRARAHPWESGSSWVVQGLIQRLLGADDSARQWRQAYCTYVLPMANMDGVARGHTRFNLRGRDLNRGWDKPADPDLVPENYALEEWLKKMVQAKSAPDLALELHNDGAGLLQLSRSPGPNLTRYLDHMALLERLLRKDTWFTEGSSQETFRNPGSLGEGWFERFGVDAAIHELNCNWIQGLNAYPSAKHWQEYGAELGQVFYEYFAAAQP
jgi:hypothetical protein